MDFPTADVRLQAKQLRYFLAMRGCVLNRGLTLRPIVLMQIYMDKQFGSLLRTIQLVTPL